METIRKDSQVILANFVFWIPQPYSIILTIDFFAGFYFYNRQTLLQSVYNTEYYVVCIYFCYLLMFYLTAFYTEKLPQKRLYCSTRVVDSIVIKYF